jgi:WhiB family transcriptional regulator, redox-sensing transcriptional regulator
VQEPNWLDQARCRGMDPDRFFVRGIAQARPVIRVCERCPVRDQCLDYAVANDITFGVWGGLTERQRRAYQRKQYAEAS